MEKEYLTTTEAAKIFKVTRFTVLNWVKQGKLRAVTTSGGHQRILKDDITSVLGKSKASCLTVKDAVVSSATVLPCWEAKEARASGRHNCQNCLVFKEQVNRCFLTVKAFGSEKVLCSTDCLNCLYFAKYFPQQKNKIEGMRQKAVAQLVSTIPHADKADVANLLRKGFYVSGRCVARMKKGISKVSPKRKLYAKN